MSASPLQEEYGQAVDRERHPEPQGRVDLDDVAIEPRAFMHPLRDLQLRRDIGIDAAAKPQDRYYGNQHERAEERPRCDGRRKPSGCA